MEKTNSTKLTAAPQALTAIDIGSNSFHMVIARPDQQELRPIEQLGEKVQLAAGMVDGQIAPEAIERGLACLQRFKQRIDSTPDGGVLRVVGTNALRAAKNGRAFIDPAEALLGCPVEVIAGREEARLVYLGVAHTLADDYESRLVIDIGGGSTEMIVGHRFESRVMESLHMGCVSYLRFFPNGEITRSNFQRAYNSAYRELINVLSLYRGQWHNCVGSSGTLLAIEQVMINCGFSEGGIERSGLSRLQSKLFEFENIEEVSFQGLKESRRQVFASGLAITKALFDALEIDRMVLSDGALREGVLYDLMGRLSHEDVRERTVSSLEQRYDIDTQRVKPVVDWANQFWSQVAQEWGLAGETDRQLLLWAARLHEIGLAVSHSQYHKHGEYLLHYADLAGFSRQEQEDLATLVRAHRRKFNPELFNKVERSQRSITRLMRLAIVLRLAVLFKHTDVEQQALQITVESDDRLQVHFDSESFPLTEADLQQEQVYLRNTGIDLVLSV